MTRGARLLSVLPCFVVPDVEASAAHYRDRLGFRVCGVYGQQPEQFGIVDRAEGQGFHFKSNVACATPGAPPTRVAGRRNRTPGGEELDAFVRVPDADRLHAEFARRGARILAPPADRFPGRREFLVQDGDDHVLCFSGDVTGTWPADGFTTSPEFIVADIPRSVAFYRDQLDFPHVATFFDPPTQAVVRRESVRLHFRRAAPGRSPAPPSNRAQAEVWDACIEVVGVDLLAAEFRARGVPIVRGPVDTFYGSREFELADPDGYHIAFTELAE